MNSGTTTYMEIAAVWQMIYTTKTLYDEEMHYKDS